ncbi:molybdenum ABC transporter ATP-binding protein ModC [Vibrio sp. JPW-9-11-11]|uniref:molybdenum ABC transporter ATP-binding protein ModC n=1 Tax=Vibrio sp. JPW-9-11-11 TaxID=1416532 RepID=UPI00159434D4|nr:molybdenum ABC transporter ATP-binding protein ModC [Vibrio sp. JPW-9-11-11]NVD07883.1 molybdenum ABC transporter ATP-binding protein ModC [Vibrio sp. JPW-9-11-11]
MSNLVIQYRQRLGSTDFDVDLRLPDKGITAIFGRSGAGKTSLINAVAGLTTPQQGVIKVGHEVLYDSSRRIDVPVHHRQIGYVFQDARLFPHYKVKGNLLYGVEQFDPQHFAQIVDLLALAPLLTRYPNQLSGGEKQRVAIGRALLSKPRILLMDEPLASLDLPRKREVMPFLEQLAKCVQIPILYVSHSLNEVLRLASQLVVIDLGKVVASGPIEQIWASQAMKPWHSFSEQSSLFEGRLIAHNESYALSQVELAPRVSLWVQKIEGEIGQSVRLQVRANDVSVVLDKPQRTSIRNVLPATIADLELRSHGHERQSIELKIELAPDCLLNATITAWARDELKLEKGMPVYVQIKGVSVTQRDIVVNSSTQ